MRHYKGPLLGAQSLWPQPHAAEEVEEEVASELRLPRSLKPGQKRRQDTSFPHTWTEGEGDEAASE
jgi:hypothetical protein